MLTSMVYCRLEPAADDLLTSTLLLERLSHDQLYLLAEYPTADSTNCVGARQLIDAAAPLIENLRQVSAGKCWWNSYITLCTSMYYICIILCNIVDSVTLSNIYCRNLRKACRTTNRLALVARYLGEDYWSW